ncbi:hypothetical protein [Microcoleus sp. OTE_8_concoct_300]|uniref:hypothetical protein n=1 Tax=Microcoleus sp. OTE_8_concoct_300 TaxID=2964710 RepID=UPI00403F20A8
MNLKELVRFLKYEADLPNFFQTSANYYHENQTLPSQTESQKIKVALAVSDQKEGRVHLNECECVKKELK